MTDRELLELLVQKVTGIEKKIAGIETKMATIESDVASFKSDVSTLKRDMSQVIQAVLETNETVKRIEQYQQKTESELNHHSYSIDVLNREQFYLKTELEKLKNR